MRYACRCSNSKCRARRTLQRHPLAYMRTPRCVICAAPMRLDGHRQAQRARLPKDRTDPAPVCGCDGAHYPHRRGWVRLCMHFEDRLMAGALRGRRFAEANEPGF